MPLARISLTLSHHFSLSFIASGRSSGLHPVSLHSCSMYVCAGRPAFAQPYVGVLEVKKTKTKKRERTEQQIFLSQWFLREKFAVLLFNNIRNTLDYRYGQLEIFYESSSSCRAPSTDIPDPLLPLLPIVHRLW